MNPPSNGNSASALRSPEAMRTLFGFGAALAVTIAIAAAMGIQAKRHHVRIRWGGDWVWSYNRVPQEFREGPHLLYAHFRHLRTGPLSLAATEDPLDLDRRLAEKYRDIAACHDCIRRGEFAEAEKAQSRILNEPVAIGASPLDVVRDYILTSHQIALAKGDYSNAKKILDDGPPCNSPLPVFGKTIYPSMVGTTQHLFDYRMGTGEGLILPLWVYQSGEAAPDGSYPTSLFKPLTKRFPEQRLNMSQAAFVLGLRQLRKGMARPAQQSFECASELQPTAEIPEPGGMARAYLRLLDAGAPRRLR